MQGAILLLDLSFNFAHFSLQLFAKNVDLQSEQTTMSKLRLIALQTTKWKKNREEELVEFIDRLSVTFDSIEKHFQALASLELLCFKDFSCFTHDWILLQMTAYFEVSFKKKSLLRGGKNDHFSCIST